MDEKTLACAPGDLVEVVAGFLKDYANRCRRHTNDLAECEALTVLRLLSSHGCVLMTKRGQADGMRAFFVHGYLAPLLESKDE